MWKQRCSATIFFHSINPTRDGDAIQKEAFRRKFQCFRFHEKQFDQAGIFKNDLVVFLYSSGYEFFSTDFKVPMFYTFLLFGCIVKYKFKLLNYCHKYSLKKGKTSKTPNNFTNMGFLKTNELKCLARSLTRKKINKVLSTKDLPSVNSKHTCNPRNSKLANFSNTHVKCIGNLNEIKIDFLDRTQYV